MLFPTFMFGETLQVLMLHWILYLAILLLHFIIVTKYAKNYSNYADY